MQAFEASGESSTRAEPSERAESELAAALDRALRSTQPVIARLSYAGTSVQFHVDGGSRPVTLLLDRRPPTLANGVEPAEIEIRLTPDQANRFANGQLPMPEAIISGAVPTRGPVRRYLEIDPILRGLLREGSDRNGSFADLPARKPRTDSEALDSDLLALETRNLHKAFGRTEVLKGANLRVPEGVVSVVLGPSGTGKSVLLSHVIGLMRPDQGEVLVRGRSLKKMSRSEILQLRTEIGVMFQDGALFSTMNLYDNVAFPLRQHTNLKEPAIKEIVEDQLDRVGLSQAMQRMPNQLSGGMRKRAGLARALVLEPGIVICDEPDSGLDPVRTALLGDLLLEQHAQLGGTILVITHNIDLARRVSDHISVLYGGKVVEAEMSEAIMNSDNEFVRQFLAGETRGPLGMD